MKIDIDTKTMHPRHDISRALSNIKSLTVKIGGKAYSGPATLEDEEGHLVLSFKAKSPVKAPKKTAAKRLVEGKGKK